VTPRARVEAVLRAGGRIADAADPLGREARRRLVETSGLSAEGVALALAHHLETRARSEELEALVAACEPAPRCHVVLAANVCTAPLRAVACALASAPTVCLRPSRRDPVVAELLVEALGEDRSFSASVSIVRNEQELSPEPGEALHVYGSDETIADIRQHLAAGVRLWAHGTGIGLAVVEDTVGLDSAATAFALDLVPFDGRGCLSPRLVMVHGDEIRARAFCEAAHAALLREGEAVPRGPLSPDDAAVLRRYRDTLIAIGDVLEGGHHLLAFDPSPETLALGPPLRSALVIPARAIPEPVRRIAPRVTALGHAGEGTLYDALTELLPRARRSPLGQMQRPAFDGPVDLRAH
jgi:acyl-CoA reductase-like NAD-dependent aldehyde dehydrogenase